MEHQLTDTGPEAERVLIELTRRMPVWKRMALASELTSMCRLPVMAGLRRRHPRASEHGLRCRPASRTLPRQDVTRVYGWDRERDGY